MSTKAIDYKVILKRDGQTQGQRLPQWLDPSIVPIDARTKEDFFEYLKAIAKEINFYDLDKIHNTVVVNGSWEDFFNLDTNELTDLAAQASLPPHIALWNAFIELHEKPKRLMNTLTRRHLDFYYGDVLRLKKKDPLADMAHVVFELKKNTADTLLIKGTTLLAGKDKIKKELHYQLTHDIIVNKSKVEQLKSLHVNAGNANMVRYAPVANSSDGLGAALDKANPRWNAFGDARLPAAQVGFCLASDVLKMKEGNRSITVDLILNNLPPAALESSLRSNLFKVSITGEKGWIGPKVITPGVTSGDKVFNATFTFNVDIEEPAIAVYDRLLHGGNLDTRHPVLQVLINNEKQDFGYKDLAAAELLGATIKVEAKGIKNLLLENDHGAIDTKKPFYPFGSTPEKNSNFFVGSEEAFSKRLKSFSLDVEWKNVPASNLSTYFSGYRGSHSNEHFTARAAFKDGFNWDGNPPDVKLFNSSNAQVNTTWEFTNPAFAVKRSIHYFPELSLKASRYSGLPLQQRLTSNMAYLMPAFSPLLYTNVHAYYKPFFIGMVDAYKAVRKGGMTLRLRRDFLFKQYRENYTKEVMLNSTTPANLNLPNEPFAPQMQSIVLNYVATTAKTSFTGTTINDYVDEEVEFFHYGAFGQMREHAFARSQYSFLNNQIVKLFPEYSNEGEFFIGLSGLKAQDSVCILFQTADGSANPDKLKADIQWSVLCDNYWKDLNNEDFIFDTTNEFLTSGIINFVIPREATTINTILPDGLLWLKAAIAKDADAVCSLIDVQSNAAIALFDNQDNDPSHFADPLPANTIKKLDPEIGSITGIKQPYASFGGLVQENEEAFYTRVSERLRHKERGITLWDYERLILQHYPNIHKVKCINHASANSFYHPGNVLVVVVPDLTNRNAMNPLQPKVDKNTLDGIYTLLQNHCSSWVTTQVSNPYYEPVKISVRIKLKRGYEFNFYEKIVDRKLQEFLSPWIKNAGGGIYFGGKITASMIVKFMEELEFVDFIADLSLSHSTDNGNTFVTSVNLVEASSPASILVSSDHHEIYNY